MGTLGGFPNPPAKRSAGRSPTSHTREINGNPGRVPKPSREELGRAKPDLAHARNKWEPWEGSQTLPRRARPGEARPRSRDRSVSPQRLEELGAGGVELVLRLDPLGGGRGEGELRVAELDDAADAGRVAPFGQA